MKRNEAIAAINTKLSSLDDDGVLAVADIVADIGVVDDLQRDLTPRELVLIAQSKADFEAGRVVTSADYSLEMAQFFAQRRAKASNVR
jgi:hypothetical protein